jgi:transposase
MLKAIKITQKRIEEQILFIGLDVHYKQWNISVIGQEQVHIKGQSVAPNSKKLVEFIKSKFECNQIKLAYEAGFCGFYIVRELIAEGIDAIVINPADVPTSDKDGRYKTDERDSLKIAMSLRANMLDAIYVPELEDEQNQGLFRRRMDLVKKQTRIKNQIKSLLKKYGIKPEEKLDKIKVWSAEYLYWLNEVVKQNNLLKNQLESMLRELDFIKKDKGIVEAQLAELAQSERYKSKYDSLIKIPGIGKIIAMSIILELIDMNRFKRFSNLASYVGIIPTEHSSGEKRHLGRMTRRSKAQFRTLLIEAAWITVSKDEVFKQFYKTLLLRMKPQEAIIRCAKKLLRRIYFILITDKEYEINHAA